MFARKVLNGAFSAKKFVTWWLFITQGNSRIYWIMEAGQIYFKQFVFSFSFIFENKTNNLLLEESPAYIEL